MSKTIMSDLLGPLDRFFHSLGACGISSRQIKQFHKGELEKVKNIAICINYQTLFSTPKQQIELMLRINRELWHTVGFFSKDAILERGDPPEFDAPTQFGLRCVTLIYNSGNPVDDFRRNWQAYWYLTHGEREPSAQEWFRNGKLYPLRVDGKQLRARPKGFFWAIVEFGRAFNKISPLSIAEKIDSLNSRIKVSDQKIFFVGPEFTLLPVMHPKWSEIVGNPKVDNNCPALTAPGMMIEDDKVSCPHFSMLPGLPRILVSHGARAKYEDYSGYATMTIPGWDSERGKWIKRSRIACC